ncbi:MAG: hypothetical protein KJZ87_18675 [Thermoguttaceae bacterium]|nr:hypothetical protein [Thermoguttaceae bacterium]
MRACGYHSDEWADLTPGSDRMLRGMHETYCGWEQLVFPEKPGGTGRDALAVGLRFSMAL